MDNSSISLVKLGTTHTLFCLLGEASEKGSSSMEQEARTSSSAGIATHVQGAGYDARTIRPSAFGHGTLAIGYCPQPECQTDVFDQPPDGKKALGHGSRDFYDRCSML